MEERLGSGFFHFLESGGGFFPVGSGGGELVDDAAEFAVEVLGLTGSRIGFRSFEFGGEFGLLGFEHGDGFFQLADLFAEFTNFVRCGFFRGWGGFGFGDWLWCGVLFRSGVSEAGGERGAGVASFRFFQVVVVVASVGREAS